MKENKTTANGGIGFVGLLTIAFIVLKLVTIAFIVLKLVGVITWSWVWVLSPLWISAVIYVVIIVAVVAWFAVVDK